MNSNQCPEDESCSSGETCCVTNAGDLGCCPYENAVCCDSNYCCPGGMKCDLKEMRCAFKTVRLLGMKSFVLFNESCFLSMSMKKSLAIPFRSLKMFGLSAQILTFLASKE